MIIADDEPIITAGIRKLVDWNELGIELVGQYMDGISAQIGRASQTVLRLYL